MDLSNSEFDGLLTHAKSGDAGAYETILAFAERVLVQMAYTEVTSTSRFDREDIVQDALMRVATRLQSIISKCNGRPQFLKYLSDTLHSCIVDNTRRPQPKIAIDADPDKICSVLNITPSREFNSKAIAEGFRKALETLEEPIRIDIVLQRLIHNQTYVEIGALHNLSADAVRKSYERSIIALRSELIRFITESRRNI